MDIPSASRGRARERRCLRKPDEHMAVFSGLIRCGIARDLASRKLRRWGGHFDKQRSRTCTQPTALSDEPLDTSRAFL